jgi:hypothetical protein
LAGLAVALTSMPARAEIITFFDASQGSSVTVGTTSDTMVSQGYRFVYTRDYLFTGGTGQIIGRPVSVNWPDGLQAQYVTAGPNPVQASVTISRLDGDVFDILSFSARLLANPGAGRAFEVVPKLDGEEPLNDPIEFDCSGGPAIVYTYNQTPNHLGQSTAPLTGYDSYEIGLTLDYALLSITLQGAAVPEPAALPGIILFTVPCLRRPFRTRR